MPVIPIALSRQEIVERFATEPGFLESHNVVSLLDTGLASPFIFSVYRGEPMDSLLTLHCDDVGNPDWPHDHPFRYQSFTPCQAERLVRWFRATDKAKPFLQHCWAGISRSGAVGLWIARQLGFTDTEYLVANPRAVPNIRILDALNEAANASR